MRARLAVLCALLALSLAACERPKAPQGLVKQARFGIFFGGQIQEREQIPFELDRGKQTQGLRVEFSEPLPRPLKISWEINRPAGPRRAGTKAPATDRNIESGSGEARVGQTRFEQLVPFKPGDPLGTWNIRVVAGDELVLDRRFIVYDERERARGLYADGGYQR